MPSRFGIEFVFYWSNFREIGKLRYQGAEGHKFQVNLKNIWIYFFWKKTSIPDGGGGAREFWAVCEGSIGFLWQFQRPGFGLLELTPQGNPQTTKTTIFI